MAAFPTAISCVISKGFGESFPDVKKFLGNKKFVYPTTATATAVITSHENMETFARWYIDDLDWGTSEFTVILPFFGVSRAWNVKLTKKIDVKPNESGIWNRHISMELEIVDDIDDYIT